MKPPCEIRTLLRVMASFVLIATACAPAGAPTGAPAAAAPPARSAQPTTPVPIAPVPAAPAPSSTTPTPRPSSAAAAPTPTSIALQYGGVLNVATTEDPPTYDVHQESSPTVAVPFRNVYEGLVQYHYQRQSEIVPELAESWETSADGLTYVFRLRKDVKWHDGRPFTAEDAAFSYMRMANPKAYKIISPRGEPLLAAVDKAEAVDTYTLRVRLKFPSASFMGNIATDWAMILPKQTVESQGDMKRVVNGTGPFTWVSHDRGVKIDIKKNPNYYDKSLPMLNGLAFYIIFDDATRFAAFRTGRVKMTFIGSNSLTSSQAEILVRDLADKVTVKDHAAIARIMFIVNNTKDPWKDARVRRAVDLALDRQNLIKLNGNDGLIGVAMHPLGTWGISQEELRSRPGYRVSKTEDIAQAKRLLADAGYASGFKTTMLSYGIAGRLTPAVKEQLKAIGIDLQIELLAQGPLVDRLNQKNFELIWYNVGDLLDEPDLVLNSLYVSNGSRNFGNFSDKEVDALINEQSLTTDFAKRRQLVLRLQERLLETGSYPIAFWSVYRRAWWNEVHDYKPGPGVHVNLKLDHVWLSK
ncbi:MAG: ABC transporter substrate-binding protein [Chloroflexota bacterium]